MSDETENSSDESASEPETEQGTEAVDPSGAVEDAATDTDISSTADAAMVAVPEGGTVTAGLKEGAARAEGMLPPLDNSATEAFFEAALGRQPSNPITREEVRMLLRYYAKHEVIGSHKVKDEDVLAAIRSDISDVASDRYLKNKDDLAWRYLEDPLAKPDKRGRHPLHPLLADALVLVGVLVFVVVLLYFGLAHAPFMQKPL